MPTASADTVIRRVRPTPSIPVIQQLQDTGKILYVAEKVLANAPRSHDTETDVHFFKVGKWIDRDEVLREEFASRNLCPADVDALIAVNRDDPLFSDTHQNATHWYDGREWCYLSFRPRLGHRSATAGTNYMKGWQHFWWFAGVPVRDKRITMR